MTPAFDSPVFRYGFLPHHSFRVCSTLHPDLLAPHIVKRLAIFPLGPCFFVASLPVCISPYTVLPHPFLSDSFLAFVFWSGLPCSIFAPCFQLVIWPTYV